MKQRLLLRCLILIVVLFLFYSNLTSTLGLITEREILSHGTILYPSQGLSPLHVEGKYIKDERGNIVFLRGVNKPGFPTDSSGWWTPEGGFQHGPNSGWETWNPDAVRANLRAMKSWGCNIVRMHTTVDWWLSNYNNYRERLKTVAAIAEEEGLYVLWDTYSIVNGGDIKQMPFPPYLTAEEEAIIPSKQAFIDYCVDFAGEFNDYDNVLFELYNEPHDHWNVSMRDEWLDACQDCINAIRPVTDQIVVVQWGWGSWPDLAWIEEHPLTGINIVYSTHIYRSVNHLGADKPYLYEDVKQVLQNQKVDYIGNVLNKSLIIGEVGCDMSMDPVENEIEAFQNLLTIFNDWDLSYIAWNWFDESRIHGLLQEQAYIPPPNEPGQILIDAIVAGG